MAQIKQSKRGYLYIAAATFFWGLSATLGRAAFTGRLRFHGVAIGLVDPLILSQSRVTFSFVAFLLFLLPRRGRRLLRVTGADLGRMALLGVLGIAAANYFYYLAIQKTSVATAIIVQYTAPVWVLLYLSARGLQKPTIRRIAAVAMSVTGIAIVIGVVGPSGHLNPIGIIAALLAAFACAFYNISGHSIMKTYDHWTILFYMTLAASLFWLLPNPPWKIIAAHYSPAQWLFLALFAAVSMLIPFSFYFAGLQHIEPTSAIVTSCLEPVFSILIAALVLNEKLRPSQAVGVIIVLAAVVLLQWPEARSEKLDVLEPLN